jgi:hypothetical protein
LNEGAAVHGGGFGEGRVLVAGLGGFPDLSHRRNGHDMDWLASGFSDGAKTALGLDARCYLCRAQHIGAYLQQRGGMRGFQKIHHFELRELSRKVLVGFLQGGEILELSKSILAHNFTRNGIR